MGRLIDIIGNKYGRLTVISRADLRSSKRVLWNCMCECGKEVVVEGPNIKTGHTKSCGCLSLEKISVLNKTHGLRHTPEYETWSHMRARCEKLYDKSYSRYGSRGITVDPRWQSFETFFADMGKRPEGTSLDRIDNDGNYCKENCKWSTKKEQARNRRTSHNVVYKGLSKTLSEWSEITGIKVHTLRHRVVSGWTLEEAFNKPVLTYI